MLVRFGLDSIFLLPFSVLDAMVKNRNQREYSKGLTVSKYALKFSKHGTTMEKLENVKNVFNLEDFQETLESKFFTANIIQSSEQTNNPKELRKIIKGLAKLAGHRQGVIRGLSMKVAELECKQSFNIDQYSEFFKD